MVFLRIRLQIEKCTSLVTNFRTKPAAKSLSLEVNFVCEFFRHELKA